MVVRIDLLPEHDVEPAATLLGRACPYDRAAEVAAEKLFGGAPPPLPTTTLGAWQGERLGGVAVVSGRWLRLLAVEPELRGRGIGRALLAEALARRPAGEARVRVADQPGNYLAPGVDARDTATIEWFLRRGFSRVGSNENLNVLLRGNPLVTAERAAAVDRRLADAGYQLRRAAAAEGPALLAWIRQAFGPGWAFEVGRALDGALPTVHVALEGGDYVAFAAHDGNNRGLGWFGPTATAEAHRGRGLGQALLLRCLLDLVTAGRREAPIAWIGPRRYYERTVGAVSGRRFVVLERLP